MKRFGCLYATLMAWSLDGWWCLIDPMTSREWHRYFIDGDYADDIIEQERPGEVAVRFDDSALAKRIEARGPPKAGVDAAMKIARAKLGMVEA